MTPRQLTAFAAVVRLGSVKAAAVELGVTEAAISLNVAQLRKELGDRLYSRTASGLAFTPGGLRLARRSVELLGLQQRTVDEVRQAGAGRRMLRLAASSLFAEYAAPGLISAFAERARDLDVELRVFRTEQFAELLRTRLVDVAIGPTAISAPAALEVTHFMNYRMLTVAASGHPVTRTAPSVNTLRAQTWLLGPSAVEQSGVMTRMLKRLGIGDDRQRIFQSHQAAIEETKRGHGLTVVPTFAVPKDLQSAGLGEVLGPQLQAQGAWNLWALGKGKPSAKQADELTSAAAELTRYLTTPRALRAIMQGRGVSLERYKPAVHVTLWS